MKLTPWQRIIGHAPDPKPPEKVVGSYNGFDMDRWQASPEHINYARQLFAQPLFRDLLAVLANSRPNTAGLHIDAARALGWVEGYEMLMSRLLSLTLVPTPEQEEVKADYSAGEWSGD